jgi:hypothetical protein
VEAHLRPDLCEGFPQEVGASHPQFEGSERVLDGLPPDARSVGRMIQPRLHLVEDMFLPPALKPLELVWGALRSERTGEASRQMTVTIDVVPSNLSVRVPWSAFAQLGRCSDRSQRRK